MKNKTVLKTIEQLKRAGYSKVSLHELAWHTSLHKDEVLTGLRNTVYATKLQNDETYIKLGK